MQDQLIPSNFSYSQQNTFDNQKLRIKYDDEIGIQRHHQKDIPEPGCPFTKGQCCDKCQEKCLQGCCWLLCQICKNLCR